METLKQIPAQALNTRAEGPVNIFKMIKVTQLAEDFGIKWFENGASKQIIYSVYKDDKLVKTLISTEYDKTMYCHILKVAGINGDYFEYRFSVNAKKKFWTKALTVINVEA